MSDLHIKATISMTELRRNKPIAYLLSTRAYETLLELIDDASLIQTVMARKGGNTIKVKI
jgi:hypothetical protein